jgi:hypothetical protein
MENEVNARSLGVNMEIMGRKGMIEATVAAIRETPELVADYSEARLLNVLDAIKHDDQLGEMTYEITRELRMRKDGI